MLSSSNGKLWGVLELALPAHRLPQLAAWLRTRRGALRTLSLSLSPPAGAWPRDLHIQQRGFYVGSPALVAAVKLLFSSLQGAARLHSLRLAFVGQPPGGPDLLMDGAYIQLPHLRTLELCCNSSLEIAASFRHLSSLTCLLLTGGSFPCSALLLPPSLRRLALPTEVGSPMVGGWDMALQEASGLRELRAECKWVEEDWDEDDMWLDQDLPPESTLDLATLGELLPQLEGLCIDSSNVDHAFKLSGAERLPRALRALTLTHVVERDGPAMQGLTALQHLSRLSLAACHVSRAGILEELVGWGLTGLQQLTLAQCVVQALAPLRQMPRLHQLALYGVNVCQPHSAVDWPALQVSPAAQHHKAAGVARRAHACHARIARCAALRAHALPHAPRLHTSLSLDTACYVCSAMIAGCGPGPLHLRTR